MIRLLLLLIVVFDVSFLGATLYFKHRDRVDREARVNAWYEYWMAESATWDWDSLVDNPPFEDGKIATDIFEPAEIDVELINRIYWEQFGGTPTAPTAP